MTSRSRFSSAFELLTRPVGRIEFLGWCLLAISLVFIRLSVLGINLEPDSYQYLSVAHNFSRGNPGYTSIVHFDTERSHGTVPAPETTFPSGYPAAIASLSATGLAPEKAGVAVSAMAVLALLLLYRAVAEALGITGLGSRFLYLFTFANSDLLFASGSVVTEPLFTLISFGAILLLAAGVSARTRGARQWPLLLAANGLVGLAYWVRYAGLFLWATVVVYVAFLLLRRHQAAVRAALCLGLSTAIIGLGFLRNVLLVGTWKGGNDKPVHHPLLGVARRAPAEIYHLFSGTIGKAHYGLLDVLLALALATVVLTCLLALARRGRAAAGGATPLLPLGSAYCLIYCSAMIYASHVSVISFTPRMFAPLLPLALTLFAILISRSQGQLKAPPRFLLSALVIMSCAYVATNLRSLLAGTGGAAQHERVRAALAEEVAPGQTLAAWITAHMPEDQVIVATHGQATGYILQRPTVSLAPQEYTSQHWDEPGIQSLMVTYGAKYLIVYPGDDPELYHSRFLSGLLAGTVPRWLSQVAKCNEVTIFSTVTQ